MTDLPGLQIHSPLTLIIDGKPVGFVKVKNANPRVLVGQFELNPKFKDIMKYLNEQLISQKSLKQTSMLVTQLMIFCGSNVLMSLKR